MSANKPWSRIYWVVVVACHETLLLKLNEKSYAFPEKASTSHPRPVLAVVVQRLHVQTHHHPAASLSLHASPHDVLVSKLQDFHHLSFSHFSLLFLSVLLFSSVGNPVLACLQQWTFGTCAYLIRSRIAKVGPNQLFPSCRPVKEPSPRRLLRYGAHKSEALGRHNRGCVLAGSRWCTKTTPPPTYQSVKRNISCLLELCSCIYLLTR